MRKSKYNTYSKERGISARAFMAQSFHDYGLRYNVDALPSSEVVRKAAASIPPVLTQKIAK